ncbi:DUF3597 domain-containing protein [Brucella intermedia]|uniref:DUF3597 domain-containing protein n=1 Tax=Brucella TaxID=234 RepID=UPI0009467E20|nr:DUF3597 domain-containing protein [Brucella intermedia]
MNLINLIQRLIRPRSSARTTISNSASVNAAAVDIDAILDRLAATKDEKLNWRTSVIDLMKTLDLDSSLPARKKLARQWGYSSEPASATAMNLWLHKRILDLLAKTGGKVPLDIAGR